MAVRQGMLCHQRWHLSILLTLSLLLLIGARTGLAFVLPVSPRIIALGGSTTAVAGTGMGESMTQNPAGLAQSETGIQVFHGKQFNFSDYELKGLSFSWKVGKLGFGLYCGQDGTVLLEKRHGEEIRNFLGETQYSVGVGREIKKDLNVGLNLWQNTKKIDILGEIETSGNLKCFGFDLGCLWSGKDWGWGLAVNSLPIGKKREIVTPQFKLGLRYGKVERLAFFGDLIMAKDSFGDFALGYNGGVEARFLPNLAVRLGFDDTRTLVVGLGVAKNHLIIDYAYRVHEAGSTHYLATGYQF